MPSAIAIKNTSLGKNSESIVAWTKKNTIHKPNIFSTSTAVKRKSLSVFGGIFSLFFCCFGWFSFDNFFSRFWFFCD